jgi:hypothetical protein
LTPRSLKSKTKENRFRGVKVIYPHPKGWSIMAWPRKEAVISSTARDLITKG